MIEKKRVPEIRFRGFTDDWEQRKLGDVFSERSERADGDEELLSVTISSGVIPQSSSDKKNSSSDDKSNYKKVFKGDLPYNSMRMWQGAVGNSMYDGIVSPAYTVLIPSDEINGKFFMELFKKESTMQIFQRWSQGLTSDTWNLKYPILSNIELAMPSKLEQDKNSIVFESFDNLITLHQRELDLYKEMKKTLLNKMFAKNEEKFPEIRFKGFTEDWEQRKLGELCRITMGQSPDGSTYSEIESDYILVQGNADIVDGWVKPRLWTTQITKMAKQGDIIMSVRAPAGSIGRTDYDVVLGRGVAGINGDDFIHYILKLKEITGYWKSKSSGSTFDSLNSSDIKEEIIEVSTEQERLKIGKFFILLDNLITLHQRKIDALKDMKKTLLNKMFV